jgi:hypothetical protein
MPSGHDVVAEAGCIGIFDINKYSLSKKNLIRNSVDSTMALKIV